LLAPHFCDCLVKVFDHNFFVCFLFRSSLHATTTSRPLVVRLNLMHGVRARFMLRPRLCPQANELSGAP
jgi:hypothetical protein